MSIGYLTEPVRGTTFRTETGGITVASQECGPNAVRAGGVHPPNEWCFADSSRVGMHI